MRTGRQVAHYRITTRLGVGGMGVVYEAHDTRLRRLVALKFLSEDLAGDTDAIRRFRREAETLAGLNHPHICVVYGIGEHDGRHFIVMERADGVNLRAWCHRRPPTTADALRVATQLADALGAAHRAGMVHRDVKPGNIVVSDSGSVKLLDFGLARRFVDPSDGMVVEYGSTLPGRPQGTPNYMAPERILQDPLDPRSDLFSLGVIIYEMIAGESPFLGESPADTVERVLNLEPPPLRQRARGVPPALERVVSRLVAKLPGDRYQSAAELMSELKRL